MAGEQVDERNMMCGLFRSQGGILWGIVSEQFDFEANIVIDVMFDFIMSIFILKVLLLIWLISSLVSLFSPS